MPRLRKLRRKQKYQYHVNRKRLHKKQSKLPDIPCEAVRKEWDKKKSVNDNLKAMGLVADPNEMGGLRIPSGKDMLKRMKENPVPPPSERELEMEMEEERRFVPAKGYVAEDLEKQAKAAYATKIKSKAHPLPKEMYRKLCAFLDKYGEDFEAMANDYQNYDQETSSQLRAQVNRLKSIPEQWIPYLKSRGLFDSSSSSSS